MLERLERAVRLAAEALEEPARRGLAGEELDGRVQVRLRWVPPAPRLCPTAFRETAGALGAERAPQGVSHTRRGLCPALALAAPGAGGARDAGGPELRGRGDPLGLSLPRGGLLPLRAGSGCPAFLRSRRPFCSAPAPPAGRSQNRGKDAAREAAAEGADV